MYNIKLFSELFHECDIMCMTDDFYMALRKVMDDNISSSIYRFITEFESSGIRNEDNSIAKAITVSVDRMKNILGPTILQNTLHKEAERRGLFDAVKLLNAMTALDTIDDRIKMEKDIEWLLNNRSHWTAYIEPRKKENWELFDAEVKSLIQTSAMISYQFLDAGVTLERNEYLPEYMKENKKFFYAPNEKQRATKMSIFMSRRQDLEIILNALRYQKIVTDLDLNIFQTRDFRIGRD